MALKFKGQIDGNAIDAVLQKLDDLQSPLKQSDYTTIGRRVINQMQKLISRGLSPVRGSGLSKKFPKYKRQDDPRGYPANVKNRFRSKRQKPVNLKLSGRFLKALKFKSTARGVEIGYFDKKQAIKEQGHREGANTQPKRPTIPDAGRKEQFVASIQQEYLKVANAKVRKITKKKN